MKHINIKFGQSATDFYLDASFSYLKKIVDPKRAVLITDEHVFQYHSQRFKNWNVIVLKPARNIKSRPLLMRLLSS
jgi:3-dehydroquinate synthase